MNDRALVCHVPPLPPMTWNGGAWEATVTLPAWAGFQARGRAYGSRSGQRPSTGAVRLHVATPEDEPTLPTAEQAAAFGFLVASDAAVRDATLPKLVAAYREAREVHLADVADGHEPAMRLPDVKAPSDLRAVMGLATVHVLAVARAGVAFVGLEFGCDWDDEHGAGVMLHRTRVVKVGGADTSFLDWIATRAGGTALPEGAPAGAPTEEATKRAVGKPAAGKPAARKPAAGKPAARKPVAKPPAARKPAARKPVAKPPAARKLAASARKGSATKPSRSRSPRRG